MNLERLVDAGPRVVGLFHLQAIGRESGLELEEYPGVVFTLDAGKVVQIDAYPTQAEALEAVGLRE
jgi:ketosteroid isomerase-like protein